MRKVEFRRLFDDENAARVRFEVDQKQILRFVVQLECYFSETWTPVLRYDTAHNFAHCDVLHPFGETEKIEMPTQDYNEALTFAINDLINNWQRYRQRYEQWLNKK